MGFVMPAVCIQDNLQLFPNQYIIRVEEIEANSGELHPSMLLVMDPRGDAITLSCEATTELTFGLSAVWIGDRCREEALFRSYTVVDAATVLTTHLTELIRDNMVELLSYEEAQRLIDDLDKPQQKFVANLIPNQISLGGVQRVQQNLLAERFSIRDLPTILEGISEVAAFTRNLTFITEHVRTQSARQLSDVAVNMEGIIPLVTLSLNWEQSFAELIVGQGEERQLAMAPSTLQQFIVAIRKTFEKQYMQDETPVLMVSPGIRPFVRFFIERFRPTTVVISQCEIYPKANLLTLDQV